MTVFLGLTGSIGMGKSTTAEMFRDMGIKVHDSDATVHALYRGKAAPHIEAAFPGTVENGEVNRARLSQYVVGNEEQMRKLESIIHPMVRQAELGFRKSVQNDGHALAVLDIPLLFETGGQDRVDAILVVTAPPDIQKQRVLARQGMTEDKFEAILKRQVPDSTKRQKAQYIIDTSLGLNHARNQVSKIIADISNK